MHLPPYNFGKEGPRPSEHSSSAASLLSKALVASASDKPFFNEQSDPDDAVFKETLLDSLGLLSSDSSNRDGLALMDRLVGQAHDFSTFRQVIMIMQGVDHLVDDLNGNQANPHQEQLALMLAEVAANQYRREGDICSGARAFIEKAPDRVFALIDPTLKADLAKFKGDAEEDLMDEGDQRGFGFPQLGRRLPFVVLPPINMSQNGPMETRDGEEQSGGFAGEIQTAVLLTLLEQLLKQSLMENPDDIRGVREHVTESLQVLMLGITGDEQPSRIAFLKQWIDNWCSPQRLLGKLSPRRRDSDNQN